MNQFTTTKPFPGFNASTSGNFSAFQMPTGPNTNYAPAILGVEGSLLLVSILLVTARVLSRLQPSIRLYWDDWTVLAATILAVVNYIIDCVAVVNGFGHPGPFISFPRQRAALELLFVNQVIWYFSITLEKLSVACLLYRLKHDSRHWRIFLRIIMVVLVLTVVVQTVFQFVQCRPFMVYWDPRVFFKENVKCFGTSVISGNIIMFSSIQVGADLIFSLVPIIFITKLHRPRREKIFLSLLMGLGLFASFAAIMRTLTLQGFYTSKDLFETDISIVMWASIEQQFALIAATAPTLKSFLETILIKIGLFFYDERSETQVRNRLVQFGMLPEESKIETQTHVVSPRMEKKWRDEFGDTVWGVSSDKGVEKILEGGAV